MREARLLSEADQLLVREYAQASLGMAQVGDFMGFMHTLQEVGERAADLRLYAGDEGAVRAMAQALTHFESQCVISDPFVGINATWRPATFLTGPAPFREGMVSKTVRPFDRTALAKFFTVLDQEIERAGPAVEFGEMHAEARGEAEGRYTLLDPYHDARISSFPRGRGSRPGSELFLAALREQSQSSVSIGLGSVSLTRARAQGMDLDLGRLDALQLFSGAEATPPGGAGVRPAQLTAGSLHEFHAICARYAEAASQHAEAGFSLWFRGQSRAYGYADVLGLSEAGWRACHRRIRERLTHLEDDDLLIASAFRGYDDFWRAPEQIASVIASLGAWRLVAHELMQDHDLFPVAPELILPDELAPEARALLEACRRNPMEARFRSKMTGGMAMRDGQPVPEATHYAVIDGRDHLLFRRRHRFDMVNASGSLLLQHYGCPTGGLDITRDKDVALAFAAGAVAVDGGGRFVRLSPSSVRPVVYLILLRAPRDPFMCSQAMFRGATHPNRIERQQCGILFGSSSYCRNYGFRHVVARIEIGFDLPEAMRPEEVYPTRAEDPLSRRICERFPDAYGLAAARLHADGRGVAAPDEPRFKPTFRD